MGKVTDSWTPEGQRFMKELQELAKLEVGIGYQKEQETGGSNDNDKKRADIIDIALWNELGTDNIPSRPFMRDSIDKHEAAINHMMLAQRDALLEGATARKVLENIGLFQQDLMQTEIEQGDFIANAPSTFKRKEKKGKKGPIVPLIDEGTMKNSVHYFIQPKGSDD